MESKAEGSGSVSEKEPNLDGPSSPSPKLIREQMGDKDDHKVSKKNVLTGWLGSPRALEHFLNMVEDLPSTKWHDSIVAFERLIDDDPLVRMTICRMIKEADHKRPRHLPFPKLKSPKHLLDMINKVLDHPPKFATNDNLIGFPINAILDWGMCTNSGFHLFRMASVNKAIKDILNEYAAFLSDPKSCSVLNEDEPDGWLSPTAQKLLKLDEIQCDPAKPYSGWTSWNDFFIRKFKEGMRPLPPKDPKIIVSPCEATPYKISKDVQKNDKFWIKYQPYSLQDMFGNTVLQGKEKKKWVERFEHGTVYQAFLCATAYHRWNSPVTGIVEKAFVQPGTYYSECEAMGRDMAGPNESQGFISHVATRAIIIIRLEKPVEQYVVFIAIGMADVSSCVIGRHIQPGKRIEKGKELGFFQYGGSSSCLLFQKGALASFQENVIPDAKVALGQFDPNWSAVQVNSHLATFL